MSSEEKKSTPLERVLLAFDTDLSGLGVIVGLSRSAVHHWKTRHKGRIPEGYQRLLLDEAKVRGVVLTAEDLIG